MLTRTALLLAIGGTAILSGPSHADTPPKAPSEARAAALAEAGASASASASAGRTLLAQDKKRAVYRPPLRGAPTRRVGGATRGDAEWDLVLSVLAPEQTALTARASPELYWFLSKPDDRPAVFALIRDDRVEPVLELELGGPSADGIEKVALAEAGIRLEPGVTYMWSVALVTDRAARSKDVVSSATLLRRAPGEALRRELEGADPAARASLYAGRGYWYDAIEALAAGIEAERDAAALRAMRADLLVQVGLEDAAGFDRTR